MSIYKEDEANAYYKMQQNCAKSCYILHVDHDIVIWWYEHKVARQKLALLSVNDNRNSLSMCQCVSLYCMEPNVVDYLDY